MVLRRSWAPGGSAARGGQACAHPPEAAREVVEAAGVVACPGFIDILSQSQLPLLHDPRALSKLTQGVTTEIMGEGWTPAPFGGKIRDPFLDLPPKERALLGEWAERAKGWRRFGDWVDALLERGVSPNVGAFLGGGTLRAYAKGREMGTPTQDELGTMRRVLAEAMEDGALGVSYALMYPPDTDTSTEELIQVARVAGESGGLYVTHLRSEGDRLLEAIDEAIEIGRQARVPVEIYHLKALGRQNWHKMPQAIARIGAARDAGVDVTADLSPSTAAGTGLDSVLPPWVAAGGRYFERLADPAVQERIRAEVLAPVGEWEALSHGVGPEGVLPVGFEQPEHLRYAGKRLSEIAAMRGQHWLDAVVEWLLSERQRICTIYFGMEEGNVALGIEQPWVTIASDAGGVDPAWAQDLGPTHPRAYGTFPRVLATYVGEQQVLTLEEAIRKMSGAVAARLDLLNRGLLRAGGYADVVLLDAATITDQATFEHPHRLSRGIREVWVNGTRVIKDGQHTGATPGRRVRREAS